MNTVVKNPSDCANSIVRPSMPKHRDIVFALKGLRGKVDFDVPLRELTTLKIGGPADVLFIPEDFEDLCQLMRQAWVSQLPVIVLGGTNVLIRDGGVKGIVVLLSQLTRIQDQKYSVVYAEAGVRMPTLLGHTISRSLSGLEWAAGIPGTLGGAVAMNAGTHLGEMKDCLKAIHFVNREGQLMIYPASSISFSYRHTALPEGVVVGAWIQLTSSVISKIESPATSYLQFRKDTQPLTQLNAGSVFKNPPHVSAGQLIEEANFKGFQIGDAQVSTKHANFIVNLGQASATDVIFLVKKVQQTVFERTGIMLELEWKIIGEE